MNAPISGIGCLGLAVLVIGMILSNVAVSRMAKIVKLNWKVGFKSREVDRRSKDVIRSYRAKYGNGPLFRELLFAYGLAVVGAVVWILGPIFSKH